VLHKGVNIEYVFAPVRPNKENLLILLCFFLGIIMVNNLTFLHHRNTIELWIMNEDHKF
jgi:hypothetical protein